MENKKQDRNLVAILWIVLGVFARLIPHPANITPMTSIGLFGGTHLSRGRAMAVMLASIAFSDILLARSEGHEIFGIWSLFTYSGFAMIVWAGSFLRANASAPRTLCYLLGSSLGFWLWTNFGIWISGEAGMYARTLDGLFSCYIAALPFLRNALVGDLAWGLLFFLSFSSLRKIAPRFGWSIQGA